MSSSEASAPIASAGLLRRALLRAVGCAVLSCALVGCEGGSGLRPLYGSLGSGPALEQKLARVDITPIPGRTGQYIRNELIFHTTGGGTPQPPAYQLNVTIKETTASTLVLRDGNSAAQLFQIEAVFQLVSLADKKVLLQGASHGSAAFERYQSIFSNVRAHEDAQQRAAKTVATDLKSRIAAYLGSTT